MRLTPLDIQQKQFKTVMRGVDAHEVKQFLELCADEMEALVHETIELKEEVRARDAQLAETRDRERALQEALVSAQRLASEMKDQARKEADIIVANAELQADKIVQAAHNRRTAIVEELAELKRQKIAFEVEVRTAVESHLKLLEAFADAERARDKADNVTLLAKKEADEAPAPLKARV